MSLFSMLLPTMPLPRNNRTQHINVKPMGLSAIGICLLYAFTFINAWGLLVALVLMTLLYVSAPFNVKNVNRSLVYGYSAVRMSLLIVISAALLLHKVPGFNNIEVYRDITFSDNALAHTLFINFDKCLIALIFLPYVFFRDKPFMHHGQVKRIMTLALASLGLVFSAALTLGLVTWETKVPPQPIIFFSCMLFITVTAEECLFRGLLQKALTDKIGLWGVVLISGVFFALVHLGFSPLFAFVSFFAGLGYGLSYYYSNNIFYPIALHFALNTLHVLCFSYPLLLS